jgi:hypothetical protein
MDEGRNVILLFPELIDFGHGLEKGDEKGVSERRGLFAPRYVIPGYLWGD